LVYGEVSKYKGEVPDKNLKHIEDFHIEDKDKCYLSSFLSTFSHSVTFIDYYYYNRRKNDSSDKIDFGRYYYSECPLEIAAPITDFDISGMEIKDSKLTKIIVVQDPVVLQPVFFNDVKYYLIVTAWGDESEDSLVVNHIMN
jgi:kynurenine formamidase